MGRIQQFIRPLVAPGLGLHTSGSVVGPLLRSPQATPARPSLTRCYVFSLALAVKAHRNVVVVKEATQTT